LKLISSEKLSTILPPEGLPIQTIHVCSHISSLNTIFLLYVSAFQHAKIQYWEHRLPIQPAGKASKSVAASVSISASASSDGGSFSFFATADQIALSTILGIAISPPPTPDKLKGAQRAKVRGNWEAPVFAKGQPVDQPVTFHTRIKSSGYGKQQEPDLFTKRRLEREYKTKTILKRSVSAVGALEGGAALGHRIRSYDVACNPCTLWQKGSDLPPIAGPYYKVKFNSDGSMLGMASALSAVTTIRLPVRKFKGDGVSFMGHNARINDVSFSNDKSLVLSCSDDGTVRVWKDRTDTPVVQLSHYLHQPGSIEATLSISTQKTTASSASSSSSIRNKPYVSRIRSSSFYYLDKFIMVAVKNSLLLYSYDADANKSTNDIKRQQTPGRYRQVYRGIHEGSQSITAAACMNGVQSHLLFSTTSDKRFFITDAAVGRVARVQDSPHDRAIHHISLPAPSIHTPLSSDAYNIFVTTAIDNCITLWDLRSSTGIGRFTGHVNRREEVGCCLSPCLKYLATGSEDRTARIIDLRMLKELARLQGHRDVVSDVAYNPLFSQLITCSYDGSLRFYCDPTVNEKQFEFI
jgi:WD40 repeat protein